MKKLSEMLKLATNAHHGQFDKGGKPYILHPLAVMHLLRSEDEDLLCIALGHDLLEDTDVSFQDIKDLFGERVFYGILALTRWPDESYDRYKAKVMANPDARLVKMADLTHNCQLDRLKGVTDKDIARVARYQRFYMELKNAI